MSPLIAFLLGRKQRETGALDFTDKAEKVG